MHKASLSILNEDVLAHVDNTRSRRISYVQMILFQLFQGMTKPKSHNNSFATPHTSYCPRKCGKYFTTNDSSSSTPAKAAQTPQTNTPTPSLGPCSLNPLTQPNAAKPSY